MDKHSSLVCHIISEEEKKFYQGNKLELRYSIYKLQANDRYGQTSRCINRGRNRQMDKLIEDQANRTMNKWKDRQTEG